MTPSPETALVEDFIIPIPSLGPNSSGTVYVSFTRESPEEFALGLFSNSLKFISKEVDPESGEPEEEGYGDEYQIEELDIGAGDYILPSYASFTTEWDRLRTGHTATETFALTALESLKGTSSFLCSFFFEVWTDDFRSCLRFDNRITQHGSIRRNRNSYFHLGSYSKSIRNHFWRWRKSFGEK